MAYEKKINRQQSFKNYKRAVLSKFATVIVLTLIVAGAMAVIKDYVNRSEAMVAMDALSKKVIDYCGKYGSVPPESYINEPQSQSAGKGSAW